MRALHLARSSRQLLQGARVIRSSCVRSVAHLQARSTPLTGNCACLSSAFRAPSLLSQHSMRHNGTVAAATATSKVSFEPEKLPVVSVSPSTPEAWEGDLLLVAVTEEDVSVEGDIVVLKSDRLKSLDATAGGALAECVVNGGFEGKQGTASKVVRTGGSGLKAKYVGLAGLGKAAKVGASADWGASCYQALGTALATTAKAQRIKTAAVAALDVPAGHAEAAVAQIAAGALLGGYESSRFKSKPAPTATKLSAVHILSGGPSAGLAIEGPASDRALQRAEAVVRGTMLTRFLVEAPPNVCTPTHLADAAQHIASLFPDTMKLTVLEKADCEAMGMGLYLGVAEASQEPPKFIHLVYKASGGSSKKIALVGKGLTFDSGGYNLKAGPGKRALEAWEGRKVDDTVARAGADQGGAAATLGAARIVGALAPPNVEVHFIIAACENMVAGAGLRPGDVLTGAAGKTVEVNNTDAEGRLTLADALWYAQEKCGATTIVDSATLTGACIIALGNDIAGLFTPSDTAAAALTAASKRTGEKVWRMPMEPSYFDQLKSSCADMKNTGSRAGGSITAALFLQQFIRDGVEWAHLDIAGPVWDEKAGLPTGYGAALLAEFVQEHSKA